MSVVVFLGPSLPVEQARELLAATYRPPCRMGDVYAAALAQPRAIVIIDGYFEQTPAVWHKEILFALDRGIPVYGGGSMGALRACELSAFGMVGIGRIHQSYADGELEDDDEVAVAHLPAEAGYRCRSDAMVNIRYGLMLARQAGHISESTEDILLRRAKALHYPERTWLEVLRHDDGVDPVELAALAEFVERQQPDLKREDAREVLSTVAALLASRPGRHTAGFQFEPTIFWEHLCSHFAATGGADGGVATERLLQHARLVGPQREQLRERALLLALASSEARRLGLAPPEPRAALQRFRRERGLASTDAMKAWMVRERVTQQECLDLALLEETLRRLGRRHGEHVDRYLPSALRLSGRFGEVVAHVERKWARLAEMGIDAPSEADVGSIDELLEWYQQQFGAVPVDLAEHVAELGFGSPRQFLSELVAEYLDRQEAISEPA